MDNTPNIVKKIISPFDNFIRAESFSGLLLLIAAIVALVWANSPWGHYYQELWHTHISIEVGPYSLNESILHWINDGLMAMFFFVVGLEIKREIMVGELSSMKKAALPVIAAIGGMAIPAAVYAIFNYNHPTSSGWGIPMATDIAFSLGILALLGSKVKLPLKIFLIALAIADDIGAVTVIALFYSSDISVFNLGIGALFLVIMMAGNFLKIRTAWFYSLFGIGGLWLAFLMSGVHPSIAGILAAFTIPANTGITTKEFIARMQNLLNSFRQLPDQNKSLLSSGQQNVVSAIEEAREEIEPPLQKLERKLYPFTTYIVMPLFALANAGVVFDEGIEEVLLQPVSIGIVLGLFVGKVVGISGFSYLATKLGLASLPRGMTWKHVIGLGFLAGIGFTMSLFIAGLAFSGESLSAAKVGILLGSTISGLAGLFILRWSLK